jgi:cytidylate kinase
MSKQFIISISREFGSGGHVIAEKLSQHFNIPLYDKNIIKEIAIDKNVDAKALEKFDEVPRNRLFSRTVSGYNNSPEDNIAQMQFDFIKKKAESGESFVIVGRCSNVVLKDFEGLITIFINGDMQDKIDRISHINNISIIEAENLIYRNNKNRKNYHNYYCREKWGDSRNYELSINSSKLGIDDTANILETYIGKRINK